MAKPDAHRFAVFERLITVLTLLSCRILRDQWWRTAEQAYDVMKLTQPDYKSFPRLFMRRNDVTGRGMTSQHSWTQR